MVQSKQRRLWIRTAILAVLVAAVAYTLYANFTKEDRGQLHVGDKAPDFALVDMDGNKHKLSDYRGKGVFLNFWGTWCEPCEREMPFLDNQYQKFTGQGVEVLAVNVGESHFLINNFVKKHQLTFPVLVDKSRDVQTAYGIDPLPTSFLIDPEGKIVKIITGTLTEKKIKNDMELIKP
ncbi:thiol-disulfide oxidoreductase ResA [Falsibacillus albus]|uniref:Thiol-disulfide oxidoreductase ResA n=1 Tax=Falsibacillus albus TaxID=2478915 RepID=A0A3L7JZD4_9BACI|nr:thiol-disulfide oxidoreductase ResA [Falsibacillus albus]RLQ95051.1 thiol-disulfide oxidoreductase ResA [Falsibacillus albus]